MAHAIRKALRSDMPPPRRVGRASVREARGASAPRAPGQGEPLVVDLDGTLIKTDLLAETATALLTREPLGSWRLLKWLGQGRARLKAELAARTETDVAALPYNEDLLAWLRAQKASGRRLVLATGSNEMLARKVAVHLGLFDEVLASDRQSNLSGAAKRNALVARFGERGFAYVGNGRADLPVWQAARCAHVVDGSRTLLARIAREGTVGRVSASGKASLATALWRAMRPQQWLKNLLIFVPLLAAHLHGNASAVAQSLLAVLAFGFAASSVYLLNDIADIGHDRQHLRKRSRPLAAGDLPLAVAWLGWPTLAAAAFAVAAAGLPLRFTACLAAYLACTAAYTLWLKRVPMLDAMTLALLYTLRIVAGATAIAVPLSFWLLSFSVFVFLSLALVKRYSELRVARAASREGQLHGRGYGPQDLELVSTLGGSAGYTAVLVLALYIQDAQTAAMYPTPQFIWLACPLLLFWISRIWLIASRGGMCDDPLMFAVTDRTSWLVAALLVVVFGLASIVR